MKHSLAVIPARSGSKGLPDKNIRPLCGRPLLEWTVASALDSGLFSKVVVSTDSEFYAEVSRKAGAEVPFLRPADLSSDGATSMSVVEHALNHFDSRGEVFTHVALLQPTSPLRTAADLKAAHRILFNNPRCTSIVAFCECEHSPLFSNTLPEDGSAAHFIRPGMATARRQDLPVQYRINGAIYWASREHLAKQKNFFGEGCYAYVMPQSRSVDIDGEVDFLLAEQLLKKFMGA